MMFTKSVSLKEAYLILVLNLNLSAAGFLRLCITVLRGLSAGAGLFNYLSQLHLATKQINHFACLFQLSTPLVF